MSCGSRAPTPKIHASFGSKLRLKYGFSLVRETPIRAYTSPPTAAATLPPKKPCDAYCAESTACAAGSRTVYSYPTRACRNSPGWS